MRVFISADIEGIAGVCGSEQTQSKGFEFAQARKWMTAEVAAAAEAARAAGAEEVVVADGHGTGQNILPDEMPDYVSLVRAWPRPLIQMQGIEVGTYDAVLLVGHHTAKPAFKGLCAHTYHGGCIRDLRLNGASQSETSLNTLLAAEFGAPVIFSSGDADYVDHVKQMNPAIETVVTKQVYGYSAVNSTAPAAAAAMISSGVKRAFERRSGISLQALPSQYHLELEFVGRSQAEMWAYLPWVTRTGAFSIAADLSSVEAVMNMVAFTIFYQASGVPAFG